MNHSNKQGGWTLIIALVFLMMITVVTVFSLENSNIQSKMVANSLFTTLTYQECRNEQEAQLSRFNQDKAELSQLLNIAGIPAELLSSDGYKDLRDYLNTARTTTENVTAPKSEISVAWSYVKDAPAGRDGYDIDTESQFKSYIYENTCEANFNLTSNSQTLGAIVNGLRQAGIMN